MTISKTSELGVGVERNNSDLFPDRLKAAIGERSVRSFAADCGLSDTVVRQYLTGKSEPTRPVLLAIALTSGVSVEWLATGEGELPDQQLVTRLSSISNMAGNTARLSELTCIPASRLDGYIKGISSPSVSDLVAIAHAYGLNLEWLATGEGPMRKDESAQAATVNVDLLRAAVGAVERFLEDRGEIAPADKRAGLAAALYAYAEAKGMTDKGAMEQFLKLVA